ncbi:hypothetical protein ACFL4W_00310 [Planctomycetota bacterium]
MKRLFPLTCIIVFMLTIMAFNTWVFARARRLTEEGMFTQARRMARTAIPCDPLLYFNSSYIRLLTDIETGEAVRDYLVFHNSGKVPTAGPASFPDNMGVFLKDYQDLIDLLQKDRAAEAVIAYKRLMPEHEGPDMQLLAMHEDFLQRFTQMRELYAGLADNMEQVYHQAPLNALQRSAIILKGFERKFEMRYKEEQPLSILHGYFFSATSRFHKTLIHALPAGTFDQVKEAYAEEMQAVTKLAENIR